MEHVLNLSYGKDSLACLEACRQLGYPVDRVIHAEVWATDTIPADLPPMVEFKKHADEIIKRRYGLDVEHVCATTKGKNGIEKLTYEKIFYQVPKRKNPAKQGTIQGFPGITTVRWCVSLKRRCISSALTASAERKSPGVVEYFGIAADEPERIARHRKTGIVMPLVDIGWNEAYCRKWCEENDLLSPIYTTSARGGCWFCHFQGIGQLRILKNNYPDLWRLLLKWDLDSPFTFKSDGHTVHDYDARFLAEEQGLVPTDKRFRWKMLKDTEPNKEDKTCEIRR